MGLGSMVVGLISFFTGGHGFDRESVFRSVLDFGVVTDIDFCCCPELS